MPRGFFYLAARVFLLFLLSVVSISARKSSSHSFLQNTDGHIKRTLLGDNGDSDDFLKNLTCTWQERSSSCEPSKTFVQRLFRDVGDDLSNLVADFLDCELTADNATCSQAYCTWDEGLGECAYTGFGLNRETSPCFVPAPRTPELGNARRLCPILLDEASCNAESICSWGGNQCNQDVLKIYTGVSTAEYGIAIAVKTDLLSRAFVEEFNVTQEDFDWNNVLRWDIPETDCPEGVKQEACEAAQTLLSETAPSSFYCSMRYFNSSQMSSCEADPICVFDEASGACSTQTGPAFLEKLFKASAPFVETDVDRRIFLIAGKCPTITDMEECASRTNKVCFLKDMPVESNECVWDQVGSTCTISINLVFDILRIFEGTSQDSICMFYSGSRDSGCLDVFDEDTCNADFDCLWSNQTQGCLRTTEFFIRDAGKRDGKVMPFYSVALDSCLERRDEVRCQGLEDR